MSANHESQRTLAERPLPGLIFHQALNSFAREDYSTSLALVREGLDLLEADHPSLGNGESEQGPGRVCDAVVLWARNLFQLDKYDEFLVLVASAGRWGMVPEHFPELDLVRLSFAFKRGEYNDVVQETTRFVEENRKVLPPVLADYLLLRGQCLSNLGNPGLALEDASMAYSLFRLLDRDLESARCANLQGMLMVRSADFPSAEHWFRKAFDLHQKLDMRKNMGGNRLNLGIVNYKQGAFHAAEVEFQGAIALLQEVGAKVPLCRAYIARGCNLRLQRAFGEARTVLNKAFTWATELMLAREEALSLEFLGDICRDEGKLEQARRFYSRALAIGRSIAPEGDIVMEVMGRQGQCLSLLGRQSEAVAVLGRALVMSRRLGDRHEEGIVRRAMAVALYEMGDLVSAGQHIGLSSRLLKGVGSRFELAKSILVHTEIRLASLDGGMVLDPDEVLEEAWRETLGSLDPLIHSGVDYWVVKARTLLSGVSKRRAKQDKMQRNGTGNGLALNGLESRGATPIIHVSARMRDLIQLSDAFADSEEPVLITGATGTGKELFARRLHEHSRRRNQELVCINVTAIPESIFAREFFGHVQGSFSGADRDSIGLAAKADGGTLFLDEIGEMPLDLQPRLLRLLQDGTYHAIGDPQERQVNIRLIAATNADLEQLVVDRKFRADLYYRLKILGLKLPPVCERREDILPLLKHFLAGNSQQQVDPTDFFNLESLDLMQQYQWPGNVREIAMVARQARIQMVSTGKVCVEAGNLQGENLFFTGPQRVAATVFSQVAISDGLNRSKITLALNESRGNRAEAARRLNVSRSTLYRHLEKMGLATKVATE